MEGGSNRNRRISDAALIAVLRKLDTATYEKIMSGLTTKERQVLVYRYGLSPTVEESGYSPEKPDHAKSTDIVDLLRELYSEAAPQKQETIDFVHHTVEECRKLTPELMRHLKERTDDIQNVRWDVFEHIVGEYLACHGFQDIRLVGRDASTSADISAIYVVPIMDMKIRYFIEVKQWQKRVGIRVINEILGAIVGERDKHGWAVGMLVAPGGVSQFKKFPDKCAIERMSVYVKEKDDILRWLQGYELNHGTLWLPKPERHMMGTLS